MIKPELLPDENERQELIDSLSFLKDQADQQVKDIVDLTSKFCDVPIVLVTVITEDRQDRYIHYGLDGSSDARDESFCGHTIMQNDLMEVENAHMDARFVDNPLVIGDPNIVFYAGRPIWVKGHKIGALCIIDRKPRKLTPLQRDFHRIMTQQVEQIFSQKAFMEGYLAILNKLEITSTLMEENLRKFKEVISAISHDAIAPVRNLKSLFDITKDDKDFDLKDVLDDIDESLVSSESLLLNLMEWGVKLADSQQTEASNLDLNEMMHSIAFELKPELDLKENILEYEQVRGNIFSEEHKIRFVIRNLIKNSNKFTECGKIRIRSWEDDEKMWIEVEDNGIGMTADKVEMLNNSRRLQSSAGTKGEKGFGMGLSLVFSFIESMGGDLKISSKSGSGTLCTLSLPRL
ncbi:MAG: GAF domain-containing protein [Bacteroidetes bacterium]|nr:GAF domain-containing protein [Bacteroidota bacterium]